MILYAYIGEDELGSGTVGLKQARVPAGVVPLVVIDSHLDRLTADYVISQMQAQADMYGKTIRLAKFQLVEDVKTIRPRTAN